MLFLGMSLCENKNNVSVSSTAFATVRQLVALIMDGASEALMHGNTSISNPAISPKSTTSTVTETDHMNTPGVQSTLGNCAVLLIHELALYIRGSPGEWLRGNDCRCRYY